MGCSMADGSSRRTRAFVSYSHADAEHLTRLHVHLAPYARQGKVDVWDDTRIKPGMSWKEEIEAAIAQAKVAILLVSADFLASEFIASDEVPPLLEAAEREGTLIVPVILSPSSFLRSKLASYQSLNNPAEPLIDMPRGKQEAIWAKLAEYVAEALAPATSGGVVSPPPAPPMPSPPAHKESLYPFGTLLCTYKGHVLPVRDIAWSPDGKLLASASSDNSVQVWDSISGQHILTYEGHGGQVDRVAWSPDGERLASASYTTVVSATYTRTATMPSAKDDHFFRSVQIWSAKTGKRLFAYTQHFERVLV
jgi:WD40 repeat protein